MKGTPISIVLNDMKKNMINTCIETRYKFMPKCELVDYEAALYKNIELTNDRAKEVIIDKMKELLESTSFRYRVIRPFDFDSCFLQKKNGNWRGLVISSEYGSVYPKVINDNGCIDLEGFDYGLRYKTEEDIEAIVNNIGELFLKIEI